MYQVLSLVKKLQLQNSNKTENPRTWTTLNMDPKYGPSKWTTNMDPPIIWDNEIMGKSWGIHGNAFRTTGKA
jgi:hypothetical protein